MKWLISLISDLGYFGGGNPVGEVGPKHVQRLINVQLLTKVCSWEGRKVIFVKFQKLLSSLSLTYLLMTYLF